MDKVMEQLMEALTSPRMHEEFLSGLWDTIYSSVLATAAACLLGLILGVLLVAGERDGVYPLPAPLMKALNLIINILRSVPFLILMIFVLPLSSVLVGTKVGTMASIPPLIIASTPFVARLVEAALREVDKGVLPLPNRVEGHSAGKPALPDFGGDHFVYHHPQLWRDVGRHRRRRSG